MLITQQKYKFEQGSGVEFRDRSAHSKSHTLTLAKKMILTVTDIDKEKAWTNWSGHSRSQLVDRLKFVCPSMRLTERKRKAKELLSGERTELKIENIEKKEIVIHLLKSLGANLILDED